MISRGYTLVDDNIIKIDGILFGIEICLDHARKTLAENLMKFHDYRSMISSSVVQEQIITSAGLQIMYSAVASGGAVFLQDGGYNAETQVFTPQDLSSPFTTV